MVSHYSPQHFEPPMVLLWPSDELRQGGKQGKNQFYMTEVYSAPILCIVSFRDSSGEMEMAEISGQKWTFPVTTSHYVTLAAKCQGFAVLVAFIRLVVKRGSQHLNQNLVSSKSLCPGLGETNTTVFGKLQNARRCF